MPKRTKKSEWKIGGKTDYPKDQLLACLMIMTKHYQNPFSAPALTAGLPLENNRLTPSIFEEAAKRAGLKSRIDQRALTDIPKLTLPAILLLKNQQACILLETDDEGNAKVMTPETEDGVIKTTLEQLNKDYSGHLIFVRPEQDITKKEDEFLSPQNGHWFWSAFQKVIPIYYEVLIASFFINLFALAFPFFIRNVYNRVVPNEAFETLWVLSLGLGIIFIFEFILKMLRSYFIDNASKSIDLQLSSKIFSHVLDLKMAVRPQSVGAFTNAIQSFEFFRNFITSATITILIDLPFFILFVLVLYFIGGSIALIPLIALPLMLLMAFITHGPLLNVTRKFYTCGAEKQATLIECVGGTEAIKTASAEGAMHKRWMRAVRQGARLGMKLRLLTNFSTYGSMFIQQGATIAIIILCVYKISNGSLSLGSLIAAFILARRALAPLSQLTNLLTRYHEANNSLKALNKIMQLPTDRNPDKKRFHRPTLNGNIVFKNVNFTYPGQPISLLKNISFKIDKGEKVAFIGRIGSGKSTILKLILGLYQASDGTILIDGTEINQLDPADIRTNIGYVPQDITLFCGSIRDNITFGASYATDDQILHAASLSGLDRHANHHPEGYDMQIGERGSRLSGGQRQTIAVSRALLNDPPLLIFDEPTNSMDDNTEKNICTKFKETLKGKTLLLSTHKASMLNLVDRIIVIENGRIFADGPKEQVISLLRNGGHHHEASE